MIRELTEEDAKKLERSDPEWTRGMFTDALTMPGAWGITCGYSFILGIAVDDELFISRRILARHEPEQVEEMWRLVQRKFRRCHIDLTLQRADHQKVLALYSQGWSCSSNGEMRVRMTLERA